MKSTRNRYSLEPPFTEPQVIYRFVPVATAESSAVQWDVAQEYVVVADPNALHGIFVYGRHKPGWLAYPSGSRALVAQLLSERTRLLNERTRLLSLCEEHQRLVQEWKVLAEQHLTSTVHGKKRLTARTAAGVHVDRQRARS